jgi:hypothetical protein
MVSWTADAFFGRATGTKNSEGRLRGAISPVTLPSGLVTKWRVGSANGELMIGFSIVPGPEVVASASVAVLVPSPAPSTRRAGRPSVDYSERSE